MLQAERMIGIQVRHLALLLAGLLMLCCDGAFGATATHRVRIYFNLGTVDVDLYGNESPLHVANYLSYVNAGDYDNTYIHRTNCCGGVYTFVQGGEYFEPGPNDLLNERTVLGRGAIVNEFDPNNGLSNTPGTLAAARTTNVNSAENGWFINNTNNAGPFDPGPYTVYGQVTDGFSVIQEINSLPFAASLQGTPLDTLPVLNGWLVILEQVVEYSLIDGDFDNNEIVGSGDLAIWEDAYANWELQLADLNNDLRVNGADLEIWNSNYGSYDGSNPLTYAHFEQGDADHDWDVDGLDFLKWQRTSGKTKSAAADADGDAKVTGLDFLRWQQSVGTAALSGINSVPEASSLTLFLLALPVMLRARCRPARAA